MTGDYHVRFCEGLEVKSPWATRLVTFFQPLFYLLCAMDICTYGRENINGLEITPTERLRPDPIRKKCGDPFDDD